MSTKDKVTEMKSQIEKTRQEAIRLLDDKTDELNEKITELVRDFIKDTGCNVKGFQIIDFATGFSIDAADLDKFTVEVITGAYYI